MYYLNYPRDQKWIKAMVAVLLILNSAHTWMTCHTVYHYSILSYSNPLSLIDGEWSVYVANALGIPICLLIQIYFSRMVYLLVTKAWKIPFLVIFSLLVMGQIGFGTYVASEMFIVWELPKLQSIVHPGIVPLYSIRVISDTITSVTLCLVLYEATSNSLFKGSSRLFRNLIVYSMERFILTTVVVIIQTCVLIAKPASIWAMVIDFVTVHLYFNSFLATLNARNTLRGIGPSENIDESGAKFRSATQYSSTAHGSRTESSRNPPVNLLLAKQGDSRDGVKIKQETFMMSDLEEGSLEFKRDS